MNTKIALFFVLSISISSCTGQNDRVDKTVVKDFDLEKYLGTWYEIVRYDHRFERGLTGVTATYSLETDGTIKVVNAGYKDSLEGERSEAIGKAKIPDPDIPSKLKVSFFWIFYADYFVLELDPEYQWAVVGSKSDSYLWILSRTPQMDQAIYMELLSRLTKRGYDIQKLIQVEQKSN